ncbi:RNA-binding protein [Paenibacillus agilis]|uniref:RNA-binding protein n=1 Tax=Paenibacillus agilis TaxID=3020863 RepID=A0A559J390_9BACL|nr:RNA-binding protein [Paenibacillus agilis]
MTLTAGTIQRLRVAREVSPFGYFLTDEEHDVILHYTELTREIHIDEELDVFLFFDTEDRLASTMKRPALTLNEVGLVKVADHTRYGYFLEIGIGRQLLLPKFELPDFEPLYPEVGDSVYVKMIHDKYGRLMAKLATEEDLAPLVFHAPTTWMNTWQDAIVYRALKMGTFFVVQGGLLGFGAIGLLHQSQRPTPLRIGERVRVRISHVREDGRVNVTLSERKEVGMDQDAEKLYKLIKERSNGAMPYSDETPADVVKQRFNTSKSSFKRAMGRLMKAGLIVQEGSWTKLTESGEATSIEDAMHMLSMIPSQPKRPEAASQAPRGKAGQGGAARKPFGSERTQHGERGQRSAKPGDKQHRTGAGTGTGTRAKSSFGEQRSASRPAPSTNRPAWADQNKPKSDR